MRGLALLCALGLGLLAGWTTDSAAREACHPTFTTPILRANLDRDLAPEQITVTNVNCAHESAYGIRDQCQGRPQDHWLGGTGLPVKREILEANGVADGREFFYVLRRAAHNAPDRGTAAVVHLVRLAANRCPLPRLLFVYRADEPLLPPPPGYELTRFDVAIVELSSTYRGKEIRLTETFTRTGAEKRRAILLRYSLRADRYVIYRPKL